MNEVRVTKVRDTKNGPGQLHERKPNKEKKPKKRATGCNVCSYKHAPKLCPACGKECCKYSKVNHFQSKCKQQKYTKRVHSAVCNSEYNDGTLSVFSVGNTRRAMITLNLGAAACQCHSRSTMDLNVACCHVMST